MLNFDEKKLIHKLGGNSKQNKEDAETLFGLFSMDKALKSRFEILTSSLRKKVNDFVSLEDAKNYAINDIAEGLTKIPEGLDTENAFEINAPFKILARVDTSKDGDYDLDAFAKQSLDRNYLSYTVVTDKNISHYKTNHSFLLAYNMPAEAIVHVFPTDSDTRLYATKDDEVSGEPSMWLTLDELCELSDEIELYNQITCRTQVNGKPILPSAVLVFDKIEPDAEEVAKRFGLPIVIAHPQKNAICYVGDSCMLNTNPETADKYFNMIEIFKSKLRKCFKTRNEKRILDAFIESFQPELMKLMVESLQKK